MGVKPKALSWPLCLDVDMQRVSVGPAKKVVPSYAACNTMMQAAHRWAAESPRLRCPVPFRDEFKEYPSNLSLSASRPWIIDRP